jgi:hypothetical protein
MEAIFTAAQFWGHFEGLEVPYEALGEKQLSTTSRFLFCFIRQVCVREKECYIPDEELAKFLNVCPNTIRGSLKQLTHIGWIKPHTRRHRGSPPLTIGAEWIFLRGGQL